MAHDHNWDEGSKEKIALHAIVGGMISEMSGAGFSGGALAGGVNEYVIGYLIRTNHEQWMLDHSDEVQWLSTIIGGAINQAIGEDISVGAGSALSGTKWNEEGAFSNYVERAKQTVSNVPNDLREKIEETIYKGGTMQGLLALAEYT